MKKSIMKCLVLLSCLAVLLTAALSIAGFYSVYEGQVQQQLRTQVEEYLDGRMTVMIEIVNYQNGQGEEAPEEVSTTTPLVTTTPPATTTTPPQTTPSTTPAAPPPATSQSTGYGNTDYGPDSDGDSGYSPGSDNGSDDSGYDDDDNDDGGDSNYDDEEDDD